MSRPNGAGADDPLRPGGATRLGSHERTGRVEGADSVEGLGGVEGEAGVKDAGGAPKAATDAPWIHMPEAGPMELRPSLLAAFDVAAKLAFLVLAAAFPLLLGLAFSGELRVFLAGLATAVVGGTTGLVYAAIAAFAPLVQLAFTRYIIEPDGIRVRTQVLSKTERRVQWEKITMLQHRRSIVDRLFGLHRIDVVIAYGARGTTLHLVGLRDASGLRDLVARRMREHAAVGGRFGGD